MILKNSFKILLTLLWLSQPLLAQKVDMTLFKGMTPRNIGPAGMSGRVTAIDVVNSDPNIIYAGTASGGLWKSTGGGVAWEPIFDKEKVASIGAIAIYQNSPDIIWVGTGEGNPRNSQSMGGGVYLSRDGGKSWELKGLENTKVIHKIWVHPNDPNTVIVGAMGQAWADSDDRGVYKTTDGGKNWKKVLFVSGRTGVGAMSVDPTNPNKIFVAMWEFRRWPWFFKSGGVGSGLYVSQDGGDTWKKRTSEDGLPEGELGRIGIAIAPSNTNLIYALVESKKNAFYKSIDGGIKWTKIQDKQTGDRPFYYWDIHVDPDNENRVYNVFSQIEVSIDGAKTFEQLLGWNPTRVHGDYHSWWISPNDGAFMINGNDGGIAISRDRGVTWRFAENIPVGQFYHINVDNAIPYNVMGGMQDNGTWRGPSNALRSGGIRNSYWDEVAFGDGFDAAPDPTDNRYGYGMWQGGNLLRIDFETGFSQYIKPSHPKDEFLRFNWNAALALDPFDNSTIYYGSQYVHKSTDKGQNWTIISPDLTSNDPEKQKQMDSGGLTYDATGAENHTTILAIAPSPKEKGVIWAGTDDGKVQITRDGGTTWKDVTPSLKGFPAGAWIPQITASTFKASEAFVVVNDYRRGDWTPFLYKTSDYGATWQRIVDGNTVSGYVLSFVQDPIQPKLMFVGTEFGLFVSFDAGTIWNKWSEGYPATVSTYDMAIQPREHDLVIGTFGRSIWILDDIRPLREIATKSASILAETIYAYPVQDAYLYETKEASGTRFQADAIYKGDDKPSGAQLTFSIKETPKQNKELKSDTVHVKITDALGNVIRNLFSKVDKAGVQKIGWDLRQTGVRFPGSPKPKPGSQEPSGRNVAPGTYGVTFTYNGQKSESSIKVISDPRISLDLSQMAAINTKYDLLYDVMNKATAAVDRLDEAKSTMGKVATLMEDVDTAKTSAVRKQAKELTEKVKVLKEAITGKEDLQGIYRDPLLPTSRLGAAMGYLGLYNTSNTTQDVMITQATSAVNDQITKVNEFFDGDWKTYQKAVEALQLQLFKVYEPLK
jgi:photosystem II stability/assembly factor-like uncharacterized protein